MKNETSGTEVPSAVRSELEARIVEGRLELPLLPGVALQVTSAAAREDTDTRELAEMLKRDPSLSAHVLRVVNSPLYSPRGQIVSLQQAVARVGSVKIREIALVIACRTAVFKASGFEREIGLVFKHSVVTALFAQEIARQTRNNVEEAFLAGLLHDVGRPVLLQALVNLVRDLGASAARAGLLEIVSERHAQAGSALANAWGLPDSVVAAVRDHHASELAKCATCVRITALADAFAHAVSEAPSFDASALRAHPALVALEIYPDVLEKIVKRAGAVSETASVLS